MISFFRKSLFFWILCALCGTQPINGQESMLAGAQLFPSGVEVKLTLSGGFLSAVVRNTSNSSRKIVGERSHLIRFFSIGPNDLRIPLLDKSEVNVFLTNKQSGSADVPSQSSFTLKVELTPEELDAIHTFPVVCRFTIFDPSSQGYTQVESNPKNLD
jgi:hypothetical protein